MSAKTDRLLRLARAQAAMVKVHEAGLMRAEQRLHALSTERRELDAMAVKAAASQPSLLPSLLRSLAAAEEEERRTRAGMEALQKKLLTARSREDAVTSRANVLGQAEARKSGEEEALETALLMRAKASGKGGVVI